MGRTRREVYGTADEIKQIEHQPRGQGNINKRVFKKGQGRQIYLRQSSIKIELFEQVICINSQTGRSTWLSKKYLKTTAGSYLTGRLNLDVGTADGHDGRSLLLGVGQLVDQQHEDEPEHEADPDGAVEAV